MVSNRLFTSVKGLIVIVGTLGFGLIVAMPVQADQSEITCVRHKHIDNWDNVSQLGAHGFFIELFGQESVLGFDQENNSHLLSLNVATTSQFTGQYIASRITEIDTSVPPAQRVKCWQPNQSEIVIAEFVVRFDQSAAPFGLTENMLLWNAPFGQDALPLTAVGVTRSLDLSTGQPGYSAIVAQDLVFVPALSGLLQTGPMPVWLDASAWHTVRVTLSNLSTLIEVSQGTHGFTPVLQVSLMHPPEPLGFEFSVDNELFPGTYAPVSIPDGLDVGEFDIRLDR